MPGCGDGWRAQKNSCFKTTSDSNNSATEAMDYCLENGADLAMVPDVGSLRLVEQFLYSMKIDSALNTVQCVVLSAANASLDGSFQPSKKLTLKADENLGTKFTCAESGLDRKWYLHNCQSRSCDHLCISPRGKKSLLPTVPSEMDRRVEQIVIIMTEIIVITVN